MKIVKIMNIDSRYFPWPKEWKNDNNVFLALVFLELDGSCTKNVADFVQSSPL